MRLFLLPLLTLTLAAQTPAPDSPEGRIPVESPIQAQEGRPEARPAAPAKPAAPATPKEDKILARIDGQMVRDSDVDFYIRTAYNEQQQMQIAMIQGAREQVQETFLQTKVLEAKARRAGLDKDKSFTQQRSLMEMDILVRALFNRDGKELEKKVALADDDIKAYYEGHKDRFMTKGSFSARHILVGLKGSPSMGDKGYTDEEAKARIAKIQAELKAGKKLEELTQEYSDDPGSKEVGGLYENRAFGEFVPEFEDAVRKQALGQVGEPVKTLHGYHLIQAEKITPPSVPAFEEVKDKAQQMATMERRDMVMKEYVEAAKKEMSCVFGPDAAKAAPRAKGPAKAKKSGAAK
jgi:peptidyl-prolyl cis-trans isomerase C